MYYIYILKSGIKISDLFIRLRVRYRLPLLYKRLLNDITTIRYIYIYIYICIYIYIYIYTKANSHIKVTDRCYIRDIHPTTGGYETTGLI